MFFDVDGTLVPETSSSQHLASYLGHLDILRQAEDAYADGKMDNREVSILDARGWKGRSDAKVSGFLADLPLVAGIPEVVEWCRANDVAAYLSTLAWEPVGRHLCARFGFAGACGPSLHKRDGVYTGTVDQHFDEFDKRDFALRIAARLKVGPSRCAAVGDSRSDLPLFAEVDVSIAFNASEAARAVATECAVGHDLTAVLAPLDAWLHAS